MRSSPGLQRVVSIVALGAAPALGACVGGDGDSGAEEHLGETARSFEAYRDALPRDPVTGAYLVEDDIRVYSDEELERYYAKEDQPGALSINLVDGADDRWDDAEKTHLSYCVSTAFGDHYPQVVDAIERAAVAWEGIADVEFYHRSDQDPQCTWSNGSVLFDVRPVEGTRYNASSFFPHEPRPRRELVVNWDRSTHSYPKTLAGIMRHELGHVLGFRHEHTRVFDSRCFEDLGFRPITRYDPASVMHYRKCPNSGWEFGDYALTPLDSYGAALVYGSPAGRR